MSLSGQLLSVLKKPIGLRLIDAVALAAAAMLVMKLISLATSYEDSANTYPFAEHVASRHAPDVMEPGVTGSVPAAPPKAEAKPDAKADAKPEDKLSVPPRTTRPDQVGPDVPRLPGAENALLERLGERRNELDQRSKELETRELLMENAEKKLEGRINELKSLEDRAKDPARRNDPEALALKNLVIMYEAMKPKDAARVFDRLSLDVLVPLVLQMNPRKASEVLASMSPEAAERLTVSLAQKARGPVGAQESSPLPMGELPAIVPGAR